jgi:hypothetical protein
MAANGDNKRVRVKFGSFTIFDSGDFTNSSTAGYWTVQGFIVYGDSFDVRYSTTWTQTVGTIPNSAVTTSFINAQPGNNQTFAVTFQCGASADLELNMVRLELRK